MGRPDEGVLEAGDWRPSKTEQHASHFVSRLKPWLQVVRPCFLSKASVRSTKLRRTAYLDGLRGFAALLVYWGHHQLWAHESQHADKILENGFGYERQYYAATFPIIRIFFSGGHFAVSVFFIISGYVLSAKPLSLIQTGDHIALGDNVASALFRRWLRLYLPLILVTWTCVLSWHVFGVLPNFDPRKTLREELWTWYAEFKNYSFVYRLGGQPWFSYSYPSWSLPVEMRGSLLTYVTAIALSRCTRNARLVCELGLVGYLMYIVDGAHYSMFACGMLLCDIDLLAAAGQLPIWLTACKPYKRWIFYPLIAVALLLGGCPAFDRDHEVLRRTPGWRHLVFLAPSAVYDYKWFYLFWAATFLVVSIPRVPLLKKFFESRFCQYLGRISFALYLTHGPVLWTLGDRVYAATGLTKESHALGIPTWVNSFPLPRTGPFGMEINFLIPQLILLPVSLWIAEMTTTLFDEPSIRIAAWMYRKSTEPEI